MPEVSHTEYTVTDHLGISWVTVSAERAERLARSGFDVEAETFGVEVEA